MYACNELNRRKEISTVVCVTGKHRQMLNQVLEMFSVVPDYDLSIMKDKQTLFDVTTNISERVKSVLEEAKPDIVLVNGDTSTTFASTTHTELEWAKDRHLILITAHRRENLGKPMENMFRAIRRVMDEHPDVKAISHTYESLSQGKCQCHSWRGWEDSYN